MRTGGLAGIVAFHRAAIGAREGIEALDPFARQRLGIAHRAQRGPGNIVERIPHPAENAANRRLHARQAKLRAGHARSAKQQQQRPGPHQFSHRPFRHQLVPGVKKLHLGG